MLVSLYTSRVVLQTLGVEDYGIYNVVAGSVALFSFMNSAMSMATQRFLNFYMAKENRDLLRKVFAMSLNIHMIITVIVVLLTETVGLWILNTQLNIPLERLDAAKWVFHCSVLTFCLSVVQVPFNSAILAHERMNVYALVSIVEVLLKLGVAFVLLNVNIDKLVLYGELLVGISLFILLIYVAYTWHMFHECHYKFYWDKVLFREIAGFSGWNIFGQIAQVLTTQGVNIVANVFCGVVVNASIGITNQVNAAMAQFSSNFQTAFRPQIVKSYSSGDVVGMQKLAYQASKFSFYLLYLISVPVIFNIDIVLDLWLDVVPEYSAVFCELLIWYSYLEVIGMPLVISIMATGKNRSYQLVVSIVICLNLLFSWFFLKQGFSPEVIFYVKIALALLTLWVRIFYAKKQVGFSISFFGKFVFLPVLIIAVVISLLQFGLQNLTNTWIARIFITLTVEMILVMVIWLFGLSRTERQTILTLCYTKIKK